VAPPELELVVFEKLIPADHYLRRLKAAIDCEPCRALVADCYAAGMGAPAVDPVRLRKLSLLQFQYDLSDSQVLRQAQVNVAFRFFLDLSLESLLPVSSLLSPCRTRLGEERCARIFNAILPQARAQGLVKDRVRLKDAPPLIATSAIPSTLQVVAQTREHVRVAAEGFAASDVARQRVQVDAIRQATADLPEEQRLLARVRHRRDLVAWGEQWQQRVRQAAEGPYPLATAEQVAAVSAALEVAPKGLNDREPKAQDTRLWLADTEARAGKHGDYYEGYLLDVSMDADSELICALAVRPANGDEGANATPLIMSEERAHGTDSASLSIDRLGVRGDLLATLRDDANGPHLTVYVPPLAWIPPAPELFQPAAFTLNDAREEVRCPGGATPRPRQRAERGHGWRFAFALPQCRAGPVRAPWVNPDAQRGRTVLKSDSEAQDHAARQRAQTAA